MKIKISTDSPPRVLRMMLAQAKYEYKKQYGEIPKGSSIRFSNFEVTFHGEDTECPEVSAIVEVV